MNIVYTKHVHEKLQEEDAQKLKITQEKILNVLRKPAAVDYKVNPHRSVGKLNNLLSLSVIWKVEKNSVKVITFYPAIRGRYESKILRRR